MPYTAIAAQFTVGEFMRNSQQPHDRLVDAPVLKVDP